MSIVGFIMMALGALLGVSDIAQPTTLNSVGELMAGISFIVGGILAAIGLG